MNFQEIPKEWGILVPRTGKFQNVKKGDVALLRELRDQFRDEYSGRPIPVKKELRGKYRYRGALNRLWGAGFVEKFAVSMHTQSKDPNYTSWYIWEDFYKFSFDSSVPQFIEG
jgi:hypothetical protein